jgi:hypothetical protein
VFNKCSVSDNSRKYSTGQNCEMADIMEKHLHQLLCKTLIIYEMFKSVFGEETLSPTLAAE